MYHANRQVCNNEVELISHLITFVEIVDPVFLCRLRKYRDRSWSLPRGCHSTHILDASFPILRGGVGTFKFLLNKKIPRG